MKVIKLPEVRELTTFSNSTIYRLMKGGLFPKQIKLSERSSVWILEEIDNWFQEKRNLREEGES
jgi:prophage regulatory protein